MISSSYTQIEVAILIVVRRVIMIEKTKELEILESIEAKLNYEKLKDNENINNKEIFLRRK